MKRETFKLHPRHRWRASNPSNQIFVANRGDVRFEIPSGWVQDPNGETVCFYDGRPPNDNIRLELSIMRQLAVFDHRDYPLPALLEAMFAEEKKTDLRRGQVNYLRIAELETAWLEREVMDPGENRPAYSRIALARRLEIQALITMDFWPEDADQARAAWNEAIGTLRLGEYVENPLLGPKD